ncbi:DNA-binding transcriptional regulator, MarR family [Andreprevotia lacus DSM 23236]|uniref:DNA-binding transcriptional regulator, MarR family n=1 Tax=Andreprevotia lacus DSM 23236 TaxID=1121001 RepID=A0A1W1X8P8_9NEIS|nr:MarR family transcriptional regulator [Andreprevotia lacus]SMC20342.1 DNA-binding transcriptional regulator, MarR family [Andreprevotia lacus DSM 23236]
MPQPISDDEAQAHALATELRQLVGQYLRRLREAAHPGEFTHSQKLVLTRLERDGPASVTELARAEGVRSQSMGATVAALQAAGLVAGTADPADGRRTIWSLTPECLTWLASARAAREDWLFQRIRSQLAPDEQQQLGAAIALLRRLLPPQE